MNNCKDKSFECLSYFLVCFNHYISNNIHVLYMYMVVSTYSRALLTFSISMNTVNPNNLTTFMFNVFCNVGYINVK